MAFKGSLDMNKLLISFLFAILNLKNTEIHARWGKVPYPERGDITEEQGCRGQ